MTWRGSGAKPLMCRCGRPPGVVRERQRDLGLGRGLRHPADPADSGSVQARDIPCAIEAAVSDADGRLLLRARAGRQVRRQGLHGGHQDHVVAGVAIQALAA